MTDDLPAYYADLRLPRTGLAVEAYRFAEAGVPAFVFHHSVRSYVYARELAGRRGLGPADYDDELLFLGCVLHDMGLSERGNGDQRFEVDGADLAAEFLRDRGVDERRVEIVWDAIALHTSVGIAGRKRPEIALTHAGTGADVLGMDRDQLPDELVERVHAVLPRADIGYALTDAIVAQAARNPGKADPSTFPGHLLRPCVPVGTMPEWRELIARNGWGDRPAAGRDSADATAPERLGELFVRHLAAGDLDGLVSLYEPEAVFVPRPGARATGGAAIRDGLASYVAAGARITLDPVKVHVVGDLALVSNDATATGVADEPLETTTTEVLRRQPDGRWRYVIDDPFFGA
ncbi:DUF4440 domain-containing protein [Pseudonocardia acaciae]|uniref:DUF4440 domain-containing protein n=1 Tax=Pseudonocardia acaciae TaxID=551276 RepID=UPI00048C575C|nr:DUF4440 domain-containing protein [Pseudonocardia acaciae]